MRITEVSLSAAGSSRWIPHDYWQTPPAITLAGSVNSGGTLTWEVQYTCDDIGPGGLRQVSLSQTGTTITVIDSGPPTRNGVHGMTNGDYVSIQGTGIVGVDGEYVLGSVLGPTSYSVISGISQTVPQTVAQVITARVFTHSTLVGQNGRQVGNYQSPVRASRLTVTAYTNGTVSLEVLQGGMSS